MTVTQMILLVLAIIAIVWGIVTLVGALKKKKHPENKPVRTKMLSSTPVDSAVNQQTGKTVCPLCHVTSAYLLSMSRHLKPKSHPIIPMAALS
ncbi:hypothetical protein [Moraxella atlantae]|nr:hypothetical protein [Moraxella atlantae]